MEMMVAAMREMRRRRRIRAFRRCLVVVGLACREVRFLTCGGVGEDGVGCGGHLQRPLWRLDLDLRIPRRSCRIRLGGGGGPPFRTIGPSYLMRGIVV